jgi:hypothetical protein
VKVGVPDLHLHDLRHTGNTLAAETGATLRDLMNRMGHRSTRAALIYLHARDHRNREIAVGLDRIVAAELNAPCSAPKLFAQCLTWGSSAGSGGSSVLVDHAAEDTVSSDWGVERDDDGRVVVGWALLAALVGPVIVEVLGVLVEDRRGVAFVVDQDLVGAF